MTMSHELQASRVKWTRMRRSLYSTTLVAVVAAFATYVVAGGSVLLDADGFVTRCKVAVASPWPDSLVRQVVVRPGDWVEAGQKIAVVESAAMARSLADLAVETSRVESRLAQLEARRTVVKALLPLGRVNAYQTDSFLGILKDAQRRGLVVNRSMQLMTDAKLQAMDRLLTLQAEETSLDTEINSGKGALQQVSGAYDDVRKIYGSGTLKAPASGYIGSSVAMVGEVLDAGRADVANIYTGSSYVLAYIPESYLFQVEEGQKMSVKGRGQIVAGHIEKVLPVTDALPPEFQLPNRVRGRGQLVRVAFAERESFAVDEKIQLTTCHLNSCRLGVPEMIRAAFTSVAWSKTNPRDDSMKKSSDTPQTPSNAAEEVAAACAFQSLDKPNLLSTSIPR